MPFYSYHLFFYKANSLTMTIVLSMSCAGSMSVPNFHVHVPVQVCVYVCIRVRPLSAPETPNFVLPHSYFLNLWSLFLNSGYYFPSPFSFFSLFALSILPVELYSRPPPHPPQPLNNLEKSLGRTYFFSYINSTPGHRLRQDRVS
jgi:hypothetical protein